MADPATIGLADRFLGWIYECLSRRFERRRQEGEALRERLRQAHELLTIWRKTYPQVVAIFGLMKEAVDSQKVTPDSMQRLADASKPATSALVKNTPDLSRFIAANSLLLPEDVTARLKEIERMADMAPIMLGQVNGESQAEALREKCDQLMRLIETRYFGRGEKP